jgi:membrane protease YdiL (CAAX protease family)
MDVTTRPPVVPVGTSRPVGWPLALAFIRIPLIAVAALATLGLLAAFGQPAVFPPGPMFAALYLLPVNLVCLVVVARLLRRDGRRLRDLIGFEPARLGRDILWGLLWLSVLYLPFVLTVMGVMFLLHGGAMFTEFETVFVPDPASVPRLGMTTSVVLGALTVLTFAPINAPTEELVYRGYAQGMLQRAFRHPWLAILIPAVGFGLQHLFFAPTIDAVLVYAAAFFVWGSGSGLIYLRQQRLMPLIVCHTIVNLLSSLPALLMPFLLTA